MMKVNAAAAVLPLASASFQRLCKQPLAANQIPALHLLDYDALACSDWGWGWGGGVGGGLGVLCLHNL